MLVEKNHENNGDWFQEWLMFLPDELEKLQEQLNHLDLDYSPESLLRLEGWILEKYPTMDSVLEDKMTLDALLRYVGEVYRIHLQGKWDIVLDDPQYIFYNLPIISYPENAPNTSPLSLVTASIDRQTDNFIYDSFMKKKKWMEGEGLI